MTPIPVAPVPDLRIGSLLRRAWRAFQDKAALLVGYFVLLALVFGYLGFRLEVFRHSMMPHPTLREASLILGCQFAFWALGFLFCAGIVYVSMRVWTGDEVRFGMFFIFLRKLGRLLGFYVLLWLANMAVILLLVALGALAAIFLGKWATILPAAALCVPYGYAALALAPTLVVLLETDLGIAAAPRLGWNLIQGHRRRVFLVLFFAYLFGLAGVFGLVLGIFITVPLAQLVLVGAYEELVQAYIRKMQLQAPVAATAQ